MSAFKLFLPILFKLLFCLAIFPSLDIKKLQPSLRLNYNILSQWDSEYNNFTLKTFPSFE